MTPAQRPGTIIMLNGTTSSGKSTLISLLRDTLTEPYLDAGIDKFLYMLPDRFLHVPELWAQVLGAGSAAGPLGHTLMSGMHHAIAALSRAGNFVLSDHVLIERAWADECAALFAELPAYLIGVRCPLSILELREKGRRNRTLGQARRQFDIVHAHAQYDLQIDTHEMSIEKCVLAIKAHIEAHPPRAFRAMSDAAASRPASTSAQT
jgi:chloramphenicol 3-O phosphotransferase